MSDNGLTTDAVPVAVTQSAPTPAAPPPSAPAPVAGTDPLAEPPADQAVFDRGYVEKVRGEAARYRTEARSSAEQLQGYQEVFGGYDDADRAVWFQLARDWATDPAKAAQVMRQIAAEVLTEDDAGGRDVGASRAPGVDPPMPNVPADLTPEQVQKLIDDSLNARESKQAEQSAINNVFGELRAAGYDPETAEGFAVLYNANHFTAGDIPKAIAMVQERDQKIIDDYVAGRSGRQFAAPAPAGGVVAASTGEPIKSIEDARRATDRFLQERRLAQ